MKKFIIIIILCGLALGAAGFWYWQRNPYSKEILKIEIIGPTEAVVSEEVEYTVKFKNNGNVRLEEPRLIFEFPEHTLLEEGFSKRQEIGPDELGDIYPGDEKSFSFKGRLFGKEGEVKEVKAVLIFRPKDIEAPYNRETAFSTVIKPIPLTFDFDLPSKIEANKEFEFSLNYYSSLNYPLSDLGIRIEYPLEFEFLESDPSGLEKTEWEIPLLNKAEGGRVKIRGKLSGETGEGRTFRATLGIWLEDEFISLKEISRSVEINRPGLFVSQWINGQREYIASSGNLLHYEIFFKNIGKEPFLDLSLVATLEGKGFDLETVKTELGQFNKGDNFIVWDSRDVSKLRFLDEGEEGKVEFWINLKDEWEIANPEEENAVLKNIVLIPKTAEEEFETKINSKLVVSQKGYFQDEVFGNSGPVPPKVGEETTYTITWLAKNYFNDIKNAKVKAVLPANVELTGKIFPEGESPKFAFDNKSREIIWMIKDSETMEAGTGILNTAPIISFQVALKPTSGQKGKVAQIISEATISGEDQWTETIIEENASAVDTSLPDDPFVSDGVVQ